MIIRFKGFNDAVIHMEKVVKKQGESDNYKFKVKLEVAGEKNTADMSADEQMKKLEIMLKELTLKKEDLNKMKAKIAKVEEEGTVDQEKLDKKKVALMEEYKLVNEKMKKVEAKLKSLKK